MIEKNRCKCGRRISKHATDCKNCYKARMDKIHAEAAVIVSKGACPRCNTVLVRNNALAGWWQCGAYGAERFRKPEHTNLPSCNFQIFTEN